MSGMISEASIGQKCSNVDVCVQSMLVLGRLRRNPVEKSDRNAKGLEEALGNNNDVFGQDRSIKADFNFALLPVDDA